MKKFIVPLTTITLGLFLIACGGSDPSPEDINRLHNNASSTPSVFITPSTFVATPTTVAPKPTVSLSVAIVTDGDWEIGAKDDIGSGVISPGIYVITATESGNNCYWARVRNFDGELDSIIANNNINPGSISRVTVKKTDAGLQLKGECFAVKKQK